MKNADIIDKDLVIQILTKSFESNPSVNFIIKQDNSKPQRIRTLMEYSFEICFRYGEVFISEDRTGCALVLLNKKPTTFRSIWLDLKLILKGIGLRNLRDALDREARIKSIRPKNKMYYLWFLGVLPEHQKKGTGTKLLKEILIRSSEIRLPVYLETSVPNNLPWYKKHGFVVYDEMQLSYKLYFLKKDVL